MEPYLQFAAHHIILFAALGTVLSLLIANEVHGNLTGGKRLSPQEAVRLINDREPIIVDLRPQADYKRGHLLNAVSLPIARLDSDFGVLGSNKTRPVLVYCAMGMNSLSAAEKLRGKGYAEVYPMRGGIGDWTANNLPVTTK
ncbi:MAG: rhodanese-like domain-containing protein [Stenotrophobium sp.]